MPLIFESLFFLPILSITSNAANLLMLLYYFKHQKKSKQNQNKIK